MAQEPLMQSAQSLIVIGGSAGSLDVLIQLLPAWRLPLHVAVVIVLHRKADGESQLTDLLSAKSTWPVSEAYDKQPIRPGQIYIAPADYHLLIERDHSFSLDYSEKVNYSRPSIDVTLETAAIAFHQNLICVLLSGANSDGANGLVIAQSYGAKIIVQRPSSAIAPFMPQFAIDTIIPDAILAPGQMMPFLAKLVMA